jgi:hypothetical protein
MHGQHGHGPRSSAKLDLKGFRTSSSGETPMTTVSDSQRILHRANLKYDEQSSYCDSHVPKRA